MSRQPGSETVYGLTWADRQFLQNEIAAGEKLTQSEIVLGVVRRSSAYDFIALLMALFVAFAASVALLHFALWPSSFLSLQLAQIVLTVALQTLFVRTGWVMPFVPRSHQERAASRTARDLFYEYDLQATGGRNALLVFVSLQERMIFLLPDKALRQRVPHTVWEELVKDALAHRAKDNLTQWLGHTIRNAARMLRRYDPASGANPDEISNAIRFL